MLIRTLCVFGTRPEAIKMAPLIKELNSNAKIDNKICVTGQHKQMLDSVLELFNIFPDFNLEVMTVNQTLTSLTTKILMGLEALFKDYQPDLILVHGDTTTTLATSLAAYYHKIPIAHIEAGLRTGSIYSPWPEEINRKLTGHMALLHFAPTAMAEQNLLKENVDKESIYVTGNTVIDACLHIIQKIDSDQLVRAKLATSFPFLKDYSKLILVTGHRRESFGAGFENICNALKFIGQQYPDVGIVYPVHLNPAVQKPINSILNNIANVHLIPPVDYLSFMYLMKCSYIILTDSGGVQEEAPTIGKPVLVMRSTTERPEAIAVGTSRLIGTEYHSIVSNITNLLESTEEYQKMSQRTNPYGLGDASKKIVDVIVDYFTQKFSLTTHELANLAKERRYEPSC